MGSRIIRQRTFDTFIDSIYITELVVYCSRPKFARERAKLCVNGSQLPVKINFLISTLAHNSSLCRSRSCPSPYIALRSNETYVTRCTHRPAPP